MNRGETIRIARLPEVDGLRAFAMTAVVAQHCGLLPFGWIGVWLFFVISGYVITRGFLAEEAGIRSTARRFTDFLRRRFFRIVPVYFAYIAVNLTIQLMMANPRGFSDLPYLLTFTFNWHMIFGFWPGSSGWTPFAHLWTLSVEEQFYLVFPLLALVASPRLRGPLTVVLICAAPLVRLSYADAMAAVGTDPGWLAFSVYAASICHFDAFLLGSMIARVEPRLRSASRYADGLWTVAIGVAAVYALIYVGLNRASGAQGVDALKNIFSGVLYGQYREVFVYIAVNLLVCALLVHVILRRRYSAIFSAPGVSAVGRISYGAYLVHVLVIWGVARAMEVQVASQPIAMRLMLFMIVWLATVAIAYASFRWFELPVMRWSQKRRSIPLGRLVPRMRQT